MSDAEADAALVVAARQGSAEAFQALVERHYAWLHKALDRLTGDTHRAADLTQIAFVKAWQALPEFEGGAAFGAWLYRIARNAMVSQLRHDAARPRISHALVAEERGGGVLADAAAPIEGPRDAAERSELRAAVRAAIAELAEDHREVVVLRDLVGQSYEEIAAALEVPVGTVRSRLHRGRKELREALARFLDDDRGEPRG